MHTEADALWGFQKPNQHVGRVGMFADILEALLEDAIEAGRMLERNHLRQLTHHDLGRQPGPAREFLDMLTHGLFQPQVVEDRGCS